MSMHMIYGVRAPMSGKKAKKKPGWREREEEHRKWLMKHGIDPDAKPSKKKAFEPYKPQREPYRRETPNYPSLSNKMDGYAPKKESPKYTGDLIVGIATMHKSNAVPVMRNTSEAEDIAKMRR
jgi:hypothetical protein